MADQANFSQADWDAVAKEREIEPQTPPVQEAPPVEEAIDAPAGGDQPAAQPDTPADPYANLPPEFKAELAQLRQAVAALPQMHNELRETRGRMSAMQSQWDKARQQQPAAEQPSQRQIAAAAKDPDKWEAIKKDFPEWGDAISDFVTARLGSLAGQGLTAEQVEQMVAQRSDDRVSQVEKQFNEDLVGVKHPNWRTEVNTPEFHAWFALQPPDVQVLAQSSRGPDAIRMLDLFSEHKAKPASVVRENRQQRLAAAAAPAKPSQAGSVTKTFEDMTPAEQWDYLARERDKSAG